MNPNLRTMLDFMGFGTPSAPIWFVGIEEAAPSDVSDIEKYAKTTASVEEGDIARDRAKYQREGKRYTQIYDHMARIRSQLEKSPNERAEVHQELSPQDYADRLLFQPGHEAFQMNLYPLGRPNTTSWLIHYKQLFGIGRSPEDQSYYRTLVQSERFDSMRRFWRRHAPEKLTICFGKSYWPQFRNLFELEDCSEEASGVCCYREQRIILTPFFGRGHMMREVGERRERRIDVVVERLRHWGVALR